MVALHQQWQRQDYGVEEVSGIRPMVLLKRAMQVTGAAILRDQKLHPESPPEMTQDELTHAMRFLRAIDQGRFQRARDLARDVPRLQPFRSVEGCVGAIEQQLLELREAVVEITKQVMLDELRDQRERATEQSDSTQQSRREQIAAKLKRLKPGSSTSTRCVRT